MFSGNHLVGEPAASDLSAQASQLHRPVREGELGRILQSERRRRSDDAEVGNRYDAFSTLDDVS